jgi:hypothetical protein
LHVSIMRCRCSSPCFFFCLLVDNEE